MSAVQEGGNRIPTEQLALRESVLGGQVGVLVIGGDAGTGTSGLAKKLIERFGFEPDNYFLVGDAARELKRAGQVGPLIDRLLDAQQENLMLTANPANPALTESRLGIFILLRTPITTGVSIELTAPKRERMRRIQKRSIRNAVPALEESIATAIQDGADEADISLMRLRLAFLKEGKSPDFSLTRITAEEDRRKRRDIERFKEVHGWFRELNIKDPYFPDVMAYGRKVYDIALPTADLTEEEVFDEVCKRIIVFRQSDKFKLRNVRPEPLPQTADVFTAGA